VQKANELVKEYGKVVDDAEVVTENFEPMNDEEPSNLSVELKEVEYTATLQKKYQHS